MMTFEEWWDNLHDVPFHAKEQFSAAWQEAAATERERCISAIHTIFENLTFEDEIAGIASWEVEQDCIACIRNEEAE